MNDEDETDLELEPPSNFAPLPYDHAESDTPKSFLFGLHGDDDPSQLYPVSKDDCVYLLDKYVANVDPIVKLMHRPTLIAKFTRFIDLHDIYNLTDDSIPNQESGAKIRPDVKRTFEPLFFGVALCALNSLHPDIVASKFQVGKASLIQRFKTGLELALGRVEFMSSRSLEVLQGFVMLIVGSPPNYGQIGC